MGFSLVELMVVVSIIGILSAVAVPNFQKYQAKSKASEAKIQLALLYTAESVFRNEFNTFATCLGDMDYNPKESSDLARFYTVGFNNPSDTGGTKTTATIAGATCDDDPGDSVTYFLAAKSSNGAAPDVSALTTAISALSFTAAAAGKIYSTFTDKWTITQAKIINQTSTGY